MTAATQPPRRTRAGRPWLPTEEATLDLLRQHGHPWRIIARRLRRSPRACAARFAALDQ